VLVVLTAFAAGVMVGVLGMVPWWWRQRQSARMPEQPAPVPAPAPVAANLPATEPAYADGI